MSGGMGGAVGISNADIAGISESSAIKASARNSGHHDQRDPRVERIATRQINCDAVNWNWTAQSSSSPLSQQTAAGSGRGILPRQEPAFLRLAFFGGRRVLAFFMRLVRPACLAW
jgi:hypothetical protein